MVDYAREIRMTIKSIRHIEDKIKCGRAILRDLKDKLAHLYLCQAEIEIHNANREEPAG